MEPPAGDAPAGFLYKRNPQAAAWGRCLHGGWHANASQSPVLPRTRLAYDACLNAGSTAKWRKQKISCSGVARLTSLATLARIITVSRLQRHYVGRYHTWHN
jgi:hypothetical protein